MFLTLLIPNSFGAHCFGCTLAGFCSDTLYVVVHAGLEVTRDGCLSVKALESCSSVTVSGTAARVLCECGTLKAG